MTKVGLKACISAEISCTICEWLEWKRANRGLKMQCRPWLRNWPGFSAEALASCKFGLFITERNPPMDNPFEKIDAASFAMPRGSSAPTVPSQ
jgi:hypothetical protein